MYTPLFEYGNIIENKLGLNKIKNTNLIERHIIGNSVVLKWYTMEPIKMLDEYRNVSVEYTLVADFAEKRIDFDMTIGGSYSVPVPLPIALSGIFDNDIF